LSSTKRPNTNKGLPKSTGPVENDEDFLALEFPSHLFLLLFDNKGDQLGYNIFFEVKNKSFMAVTRRNEPR